LVFTAGHIPVMTSTPGKPVVKSFDDIPEQGRFLATGRSHPDSRDGPIAAQAWYVYNELFGLIAQVGLKPEDVVLATVYLSDLKDFPVFHRVHAHLFANEGPALVVAGFDEVGHRGCLIEIELTALDPSGGLDLIRVEWPKIQPFAAPAATRAGPFVFFSGIAGFDETGTIVADGKDLPEQTCSMTERLDALMLGSVAAQASTAAMRLAEAIGAAGGSMHDLVKVTAYLRHAEDRVAVDAAFAAHLSPEALPAFECVAVHSPGPVPEADVQLEAIAFIG